MRRRIVALIISAASLGTFYGAAAAQDNYRPTGTRISQSAQAADRNVARQILKQTASCIYRRNEEPSLRFLRATDALSAPFDVLGNSYEAIERSLDIGACMGEANRLEQTLSRMALPSLALRAALAEESYLSRHQAPLTLAVDAPEILETRPFRQTATEEQARALGAFADCVVFHAPAEADALLRSGIGSDAERASARALVPSISQCLVEGQEANLTTGGIREMVADGLWSRSEYGAAAPTGE